MLPHTLLASIGLAALASACGSSVPPLDRRESPMIDASVAAVDAPAPPPDAARVDGAVDAAQRELGERYARAHGINLYSYHQRFIGNHDRVFASMVAQDDGGVVIVGTRVTPRRGRAGISAAVAARIDRAGATVWERDFARTGFPESEGGSAIVVPDGVIVFVLEYVNPAWGGVSRLVKLDGAGATQWDWRGRGGGGADTPFADVLQLTPTGTIAINGHIYVKKGDPARDWRGEVDASGALIKDEIGGPDPTGLD